MSSNAPNGDNNSSQGLPPFIPGLLIVSLLIVVTVLVAWRNYLRRNRFHPLHVEAAGTEWPTGWEGGIPGPPQGRGRKLEKPQLWEIDVFPNRDPTTMKGLQWDDLMPLSVMSLDPELSTDTFQGSNGPPAQVETTSVPAHINSRSTSSLRFQLPRLPFFSRMRTSDVAPADHVDPNSLSLFTKDTSQTDPMTITSDLQVSVMISMPSPYTRTYYPDDDDEKRDENNTGIKTVSEKAPARSVFPEYEGVPEVSFGVTVVPFKPSDFLMDDNEK